MDLEQLQERFAENFSSRGELGASVSVYQYGEPRVGLAAGGQDRQGKLPWTAETRVLFWSATKALASACLLHACAQQRMALETPLCKVWPEYGTAGKEGTTFLHVLSHQAGQPAVRRPDVSVWDHAEVIAALAEQAPFWNPGTRHGYHVRTFGFLVDELVRRLSGAAHVGSYFRQIFGDPLGLDLWIGLPANLTEQVAPVLAPRKARSPSPLEDPFYAALNDPGSLSRQAFTTPTGLPTPASMNTPEVRTGVFPSFGGIGTADSLARFYQLLCSPNAWFNAETLRAVATVAASGTDEVLRVPTAFGAGFMKDPPGPSGKLRALFGPSPAAFGQPGAGGSHAFADPDHHLSFAYVMNQMEPGLFPNQKSLRLVESLYVHRA
ncbi:MAG TPA: serine hydrolase domain-containing protein [Chthoniobacterales bacterium]